MNDLKHYGVLGMHWGHRRAPKGTHEDKVNILNSKIRKTRREGEDKRWYKQVSVSRNAIIKIQAMERKKYAEIDNAKGSIISKAIKKYKAWNKFGDKAFLKVVETEDRYVKKEKEIKSKRRTALVKKENEIMARWGKDVESNLARIRKLSFPRNVTEALKMDKDLSRKYTEELLRAELEVERELAS